jgi:hypothetical protein
VAEALLEAVLTDLRAHGCTRATLDTPCRCKRDEVLPTERIRPPGVVGDFFGMALFEHAKPL